MQKIILFFFCLITSLTFAQNVVQVKTSVNTDLQIFTDVIATPDSIPNGKYRIVYKTRTLVKGQLKNGEKDGIWTSYYPNGQKKVQGQYLDGLPHGEWIYWGAAAEVLAKFQYNNGIKTGHWQGYYPNTSKAIDIIYNPKGHPVQCIQYYGKNIIALNHEYSYLNKDTLINRAYYYKNLNIFYYEQTKNDIRHGLLNRYHDNGLIWESYKYNNGKLTDIPIGYSNSGIPKKNEEFRHGNGIVRKFYPNGEVYSKTYYQDGEKNDSVIIYDLGYKVSGSGFFTDNKPSGKWIVFNKFHNKVLELEVLNENGLIYTKIPTSQAPKEHIEGAYLNGYKHGLWQSFDAYGELLYQQTYSYGLLNGPAKKYEGIKLMIDSHYTNGNKDGNFTYYSLFGAVNNKETFDAESVLDSNWFKSPKKKWVKVLNKDSETHQKLIWFYPPLPGITILQDKQGLMELEEGVFEVLRGTKYTYWPELKQSKFIGGDIAEKEYIRTHLNVPKTSLNRHVNGRVILRYKVSEMGLISDITLLKTLGFGLDEVAVNLLKSFPPLSPATYNGIPIPSYVVREVDFNY